MRLVATFAVVWPRIALYCTVMEVGVALSRAASAAVFLAGKLLHLCCRVLPAEVPTQ